MASAAFSRRAIARTVAGKLIAEPSRQKHWIKVLAAYLVDQHRAHEADLIMSDIWHELFVQDSQLLAEITSARPLDESVRKSLEKLLRDQTGAKHVALTEKTDPALLGGLIARTSDAELDASVRTKLNRLATIN
jgi:ATP synthase F1 delta subunit